MSSKAKDEPKLPADGIIRDVATGKSYRRGKFLGKGGFARVYELTCVASNQTFAGKIVPKTLLQKLHQREKMKQEIAIHKSLNHKHVLKFHCNFEDAENVYIVLEVCRKRTLMELHRRRKTVTEPEARYFMHQMCDALKYLHESRVVHRDLKLGNLLLNDDLELKIADFGLATLIEKNGDRKMTMCGTPNYIAPEVLTKVGHGFEVDIWALGCILYTLLVGKPPFETESLNETYARIKKNRYSIPETLEKGCPSAVDLIKRMLKDNPFERPTIAQILASNFLNEYFPKSLPTSCLTMAPRCDTVSLMNQTALMQQNKLPAPKAPTAIPQKGFMKPIAPSIPERVAIDAKENDVQQAGPIGKEIAGPALKDTEVPKMFYRAMLLQLQGQLQNVFSSRPKVPLGQDSPYLDDAEDPALAPMVWVSKWVDYSDKYGLGYQLSDDSYGVLFNDRTRLILLPNGSDLHYVGRDWAEQYHTVENYPQPLAKKVKLINYFKDYMNERLVKAGAKHVKSDGDALARYPVMQQWYRSNRCILMMLSNGTIQMNYFDDHVKIILCPVMQAVTYLPSGDNFRTFSFSGITQNGCTIDMYKRLKDAFHLIQKLMTMPETEVNACNSVAKPSAVKC